MTDAAEAVFRRLPAVAALTASAYRPDQIIAPDKHEVVFSGKSNVGKSSMINRLTGRKGLARVSSAPGKTASVNFYDCGTFRLVDLPGYGYARVSRQEKQNWSELVEAFFAQERRIVLAVQLIDARRAPSEGDLQMLRYLKELALPFAVALTKADKLGVKELAARREAAGRELAEYGAPFFFLSSQNLMGFDELKTLIADKTGHES